MTDEMTQQGNPEPAAPEVPNTLGAPEVTDSSPLVEGNQSQESSGEFSFEDIMFGDNQTGSSEAPTDTHKEGNPQTTNNTEAQNQIESNEQPIDNKNDTNRFEYWQSQAMKAQNELNQLQRTWGPTMQQAQQNPQMQNVQPGVPVAPNAHNAPNTVEEPAQEEFPAPPERPSKPRDYSRSDALEDPQSDSGRYLEDVDAWRDEMDEYNSLKSEYNNALVQEKIEAMDAQKNKEIENAKRAQANQQRNSQIGQYVSANYGLNQAEVSEFMKWGNQPENLSMDNLVQLYKLQKGQGTIENNGQAQPPSQNFQQVQRASQVPSPMGVVPGQSSEPKPVNPSDGLMDGLINYSSKGDDIF